jgi:hypothetical protein
MSNLCRQRQTATAQILPDGGSLGTTDTDSPGTAPAIYIGRPSIACGPRTAGAQVYAKHYQDTPDTNSLDTTDTDSLDTTDTDSLDTTDTDSLDTTDTGSLDTIGTDSLDTTDTDSPGTAPAIYIGRPSIACGPRTARAQVYAKHY